MQIGPGDRRPRYSVVIPAYNAARVLPDCLAALATQKGDTPGEIIVVDDGSTDDTTRVARADDTPGERASGAPGGRSGGAPGLRVLTVPHGGPAAARNRGLSEARGEIVLFTDADCIPARDWVVRMLAPFADPSVVGVKGVYRTRQRALIARFTQAEFEEKYRQLAAAQAATGRIDFVDSYAAGYRRAVLLEAGGFDEAFPVPSAEDAELSFRLARRGHRLVFAPGAAVFHRHPTRLADLLRRKARYGFWRALVYRRFPEKLTRDSYTPRAIPVQMAAATAIAGGVPAAALALALGGRRLAGPVAAAALLPAGLAFLAATLPFAARQLHRDPILTVWTPPLVFLRALVQAASLAAGAARIAARR